MNIKNALTWLAVGAVCANACAPKESPSSQAALRENGAFSFPQNKATVLCDNSDLRFSVWNNEEYLWAQAIVWKDGDSSLGKTDDNKEIGDWSEVLLDLDADGKRTANVDRDYMLNPWPQFRGLHYQICLTETAWTGPRNDSKGRGAISYVQDSAGKLVRVDTYLIPIEEISRNIGDKVRLCYWGYSPKPEITCNSTDERIGKNYYGYNIPLSKYHNYVLTKGGEMDAAKVPDERNGR